MTDLIELGTHSGTGGMMVVEWGGGWSGQCCGARSGPKTRHGDCGGSGT